MQTKLTLRLEEDLIDGAKAFAKGSGRSVSQIVADYFALLDAEFTDEGDATTPVVESLRGALRQGEAEARALQQELPGRRR